MEVELYLPYYDYNDGAFDVSDDYYKNEGDYAKMIEQEYNKNKDIVYNSMLDAKNGSTSLVQGSDGQMYKFGQKTSQNEEKVAYSKCEGVLSSIDGSDETIDGFIEKFASQKQFLEIVNFDLDTIEEEFETEITLWVREHNSINKYGEKLGDDWVLAKEPKRNLKVHFKNKSNEDIYAVLEDCKIMDIIDNSSFILFVERITLVDKI
jgi:hypothetical protein